MPWRARLRRSFPLVVLVAPVGRQREPLVREVLASPGPFTLRFELAAEPEATWIPLQLRLQADHRATAPVAAELPRLVLQGMRTDPAPPLDWERRLPSPSRVVRDH